MAAIELADYRGVQEYLYSLKAKGVSFGIDRMRLLVEALGHPEQRYAVIHIAGTNGKGSTAAMMAAILRAAGKRTGLYTSPHLIRLGERVQVDGECLHEEEIVAYTRELRPVAEKLGLLGPDLHPTFFEFMTAMAFLQFARKGCDVAVIEVGLGGRLDATNVVQPEVTAITSISLDHCEMLGNTAALIAAEKAGIVKPGRPVVMGRLPPEAEAVVRAVAQERGSDLRSVRERFGEDLAGYPRTNLEGDYQRWNAATATLLARALPPAWGLTEDVIQRGLSRVQWPGRWQRVMLGGRRLILDASHNPEGAEVLQTNLKRLVEEEGVRPIVITGALGVARASALLRTVSDFASEIHLVVPQQSRACSFTELESLIPASYPGRVFRRDLESLFPDSETCRAGRGDEIVVVTGSIYLLGEIMARIHPTEGPGEGRLQDF
jgi:dihydrofolate synthase / folylpolyglutamate synthase